MVHSYKLCFCPSHLLCSFLFKTPLGKYRSHKSCVFCFEINGLYSFLSSHFSVTKISLSFSAPTSSTDLNSNDDKTSDSYDRIASSNANSFLQVRNAFWVSGGGRTGTKSIRARVRARVACEQQTHFRSSLLAIRKIASAISTCKTIFRDVISFLLYSTNEIE